MEGMPAPLKATIVLGVEKLRELEAPTAMSYNDMAVMIAFGESAECGIPTVNASMISAYLLHHPAVPDGARMQPEVVQGYLDVLEENALLVKQTRPENYRMRDVIGSAILESYEGLKSPHINDFLFHGFRLHCAMNLNE